MISGENILKDVAYLTETIGVRLAGTSQEKEAAQYLQKRFLEYVPECEIETFPMICSDIDVDLQLRVGDTWLPLPALRLNQSPVEEFLEAPLVIWDNHTDYQRQDLSCLTGKAVLHIGNISSEDRYRRFMEAKPAFLMAIDTRYPVENPIANSLLPAWVQRYGAVPSVSISYLTAWQLMKQKPDRVKLQMKGATYPGTSYNVVATLPGTDPDAGIIYMGGHMDSVVNSVGADDNAVGCAIIVEMARVLSKVPHKRTLRFIAFGTEEQLSVGSAMYLRQHREEVTSKGVFMCNFDSCGCMLGWNTFSVNANDTLANTMEQILHQADVYYLANRTPDPYNDLFPFTLVGVPGITFLRCNCESGKFYHHQPNNTIDILSGDVLAQLATAGCRLVSHMASENIDAYGVDPSACEAVATLWEREYGGW